MNEASCLCGAVTWAIDAPINHISHCHCSRCRKAHGVAFATYAMVPADPVRMTGRDHVVRWESSPGFHRCFCGTCGSVVPGDAYEGAMFLPVGNFDGDPAARPVAHIFVASKAPWYEITDSLLRFDAYPPGIDAPVVPDRPPLDPPGTVRGSCLCGGVTFTVDGPLWRAWNCHCSRCRKARSAAYASNLFTANDGVRFTSGEALLARYKVPEADHFTHVFCRVCGSSLPRIDTDRQFAAIPMGSLDDDPGVRPQRHIYVASKAPWYEISDTLPQDPEGPTS